MRLTAKRLHLALRSPAHFAWAVRHVLRASPLGALDRLWPGGWSFRPQIVTVNITGRCNLRCEMCMQPREVKGSDDTATLRGTAGGGRELTPEEWCRVVDQAAPAHPAFYFSGGEPLLYRGLDRVVRHVKERGLIAALVTNGSLLAGHSKELVTSGVDNITVSLDGPERVHDAIRRVPGAFRRATEGVRAVVAARKASGGSYPTLKVNCVVTGSSLGTLRENYAIARELGVDEFSLQHPMFDTEENVALHNRLFARTMEGGEKGTAGGATPKQPGEFYSGRIAPAEYDTLERTLDTLAGEARGRSPRLVFFPPVARRDWRGYYLDLDYAFPRNCQAPWTNMRLLADGTFEPCLRWAIGNVLETPLWDLWNGAKMRRFRRTLRRVGLFPACARCCYRSY